MQKNKILLLPNYITGTTEDASLKLPVFKVCCSWFAVCCHAVCCFVALLQCFNTGLQFTFVAMLQCFNTGLQFTFVALLQCFNTGLQFTFVAMLQCFNTGLQFTFVAMRFASFNPPNCSIVFCYSILTFGKAIHLKRTQQKVLFHIFRNIKGSGEHGQPCSLTKAFHVHMQLEKKLQKAVHLGLLNACAYVLQGKSHSRTTAFLSS